MAEIGPIKREIIIEPMTEPAPVVEPSPAPVPEKTPVREPEKVPA